VTSGRDNRTAQLRLEPQEVSMADAAEEQDFLADVKQSADAIARLARQEPVFAAAVDAVRAQDRESFTDILERLKLPERCRLVCEWICSKDSVLICLELCGPPRIEAGQLPSPLEFAQVVTRVTQNEELVELLAAAVQERDTDSWKELLAKAKIDERFCHLLCHWATTVHCRLVCEYVCGPVGVHRGHLIPELAAAGRVLGRLAHSETAFAEAVKAVEAQDCELLRGTLGTVGIDADCFFICEWFCSWRCVRICLTLCAPFPLESVDVSMQEFFAFGQAVAKLHDSPQLAQLAEAVSGQNAEQFGELVRKLELERFCIQLCHWLCYFRCRVYCRCVCRPPFDNPLFTHVGDFHIYADIDPTSGLTNKAVFGHGGPDYGFFGCLRLLGFCPKEHPAHPGAAMRYRFLFQEGGGTPKPITGDLVCGVNVGYRLITWPDVDTTTIPFTTKATSSSQSQTVAVEGSGATPGLPTPPAPGDPWFAPPTHVIVPDSTEGWIEVDPLAGDDGFYGPLIGFNTTSPHAFPDGDPAPGVAAGQDVGGNQRSGRDIAIIFEATRVGVSSTDFTNSLSKAHINNWSQVQLLDLLQFHTGGGTPCSPLSTDLDIEYTVDHELIANWSVDVTSASPSFPHGAFPSDGLASDPPPSTMTKSARGGFGTHHENITSWSSCSYVVHLYARRRLTNGINDDSQAEVIKTFCK
jgi:hypothetical protein